MKISVIVTALNDEKFIAKAIESFIEQDYANKELLIVDNISTDKTHKIIASYQEKFPEVVRWIKERDYGIASARNIGLKYVTGDIVGFLGADDFLHKNLFEEISYHAELNPKFDAMYFNNYRVGNGCKFNHLASLSVNAESLYDNFPIASGGSFYYRKEIFQNFQFNEKNRYCVDYEFNIALTISGDFIFYPIDVAAVFNVDHEKNISSVNALRKKLETVVIKMKYSKSLRQQFKVFWKYKGLIFLNRNIFHQISKSI